MSRKKGRSQNRLIKTKEPITKIEMRADLGIDLPGLVYIIQQA